MVGKQPAQDRYVMDIMDITVVSCLNRHIVRKLGSK